MFLDMTLKRNPKLVETAFELHQKGLIEPDTYILDLDTIINNASFIKDEADKYGIKLYFMTKQLGRNPYVSKEIMKLGYEGAVAVDFREAKVLHDNGIKLGNVGHLVQTPSKSIKDIIKYDPEIITVYSYEKACEISRAAQESGKVQKIMLKVIDVGDTIFPGQAGGFYFDRLLDSAGEIVKLPNVKISGLTSFPCFQVDYETGKVIDTNNLVTVLKAEKVLKDRLGLDIQQINIPSVTCTEVIKEIAANGGTHGEPGHGLLGTTPIHAQSEQVEIPSIVYVSEISHNLDKMSYCYGGGYYRRSYIKHALVGRNINTIKMVEVETPSNDNIDYYIGLNGNSNVGDTVVFSFRTQIFVTRSQVAVVSGINAGHPKIEGLYDSLGKPIKGV